MTIRLFAMTSGYVTTSLGNLMEGAEGEAELPIPCYLIEHPKGRMLFDTGMHPDCQSDPARRYGPRLPSMFQFNYKPGDEVSAKLEAIDRDPAKVDLVINSHLHFDHAGNFPAFPAARFHLQDFEMGYATGPCMADHNQNHFFEPDDIRAALGALYQGRLQFHRGDAGIASGSMFPSLAVPSGAHPLPQIGRAHV